MQGSSRWCGGAMALMLAWLCASGSAAAQVPATAPANAVPADDAQRDGYRYYQIGDLAAPRPAPTRAGMMLVGGGDWPREAFAWMIERAGHGRIVILRASGAAEAQNEFFRDLGGITAAQTLVFENRRAASDPRVLEIVRGADGIFIAGGDQSRYVRYWKGTPLARALDAHVRAGKPIGGTSAGLAILGAYAYGAMDGGSLVSQTALDDPTGPKLTLVDDFLHLPYLQRVITDSHFGKRDRLGRLIAFLARLSQDHRRDDLVGLGIDEYTALCIDAQGEGRVFSGNGGKVWLVRPSLRADVYAQGEPLSLRAVPVIGVGADSTLRMRDFKVERPAFSELYDVESGQLIRREPTA
ncbi:cyanophycinase [Lysobacter capsici]|uniref:cyanophycinase n=2 Tax=Lysobacter TaxID=68 RepID=UPI001F173BBE|nr:cyanophycinase [Lysobacter capsici]UJB18815.1 cyanophycinase [Lysobacter capsici]